MTPRTHRCERSLVALFALLALAGCVENRDPGALSQAEQREVERIEDDPRTTISSIQRRSPTELEVWTQHASERRRYIIRTNGNNVTRAQADLPGEPGARTRPPSLPQDRRRRAADG